MLETRDQALQVEGADMIDISQATYRAVRHVDHPMGRWCDRAAPHAIRPERGVITTPGAAPKYGADTKRVLAGLGYGADDIEQMLSTRAAATSWSKRYLPD